MSTSRDTIKALVRKHIRTLFFSAGVPRPMTATLTRPEPDTTLDYPDTLLIGDQPDAGYDTDSDPDVPEAFYTTNAPGNQIG